MSTKRKLLISIVSVVSALAIAAGVTLGVLQPWRGGEVLDVEPVPSGRVEVAEETEVTLSDGSLGIMTMSARQIPTEEYEYYGITPDEDGYEHFEITPVLTQKTSDTDGYTDTVNTDLIDIAYYTWTIDWMSYTGDTNVNSVAGSYTGDITAATSYDGTTKWYTADGWTNQGVSNFIKFTTKDMYDVSGGFNGEATGSETNEEESKYDKEITGSSFTAGSNRTDTSYTEGWTYDVASAYKPGNTLAIPSVLAEVDHAFGTPIGLALTVVDYGGNEISASVRFDYMAKLTSDNFTVYSGVKDSAKLSEDTNGQVTYSSGDSYQELFSAIYHEPWSDSLVDGDQEVNDSKEGTAHDAYFEIKSVNGIQLKELKTDDVTGAPYWEGTSTNLNDYDQAVETGEDHATTNVTYAYASYAVAAQSGASIFFEESDATWSTGTVYTSTKTWDDWGMTISYTPYKGSAQTHTTSMTTSTPGADDDAMATTASWNDSTSGIAKSIFSNTDNSSGITTLGAPVQGLRYSDLRWYDRSATNGLLNGTTKQGDSADAMMMITFKNSSGTELTFSFSFNDYEMIRVDADTVTVANESTDVTGQNLVAGITAG